MTCIKDSEPEIRNAASIEFVSNALRLIDTITPTLSLKDLEAASQILGYSLAVVDHTIFLLDAQPVKLESTEWTDVSSEEIGSDGSGDSAAPPSSPALCPTYVAHEIESIRELLESMSPEQYSSVMDTYDLDTDAELQQPSHNLSAPSQTPRPLPPKPATDIRRKPVTATPGRPAAHPLAPPAPLTTSAVSRPATHAAPKPTTRVAPRLTTPVSPRLTTPSAPKHATSTLPKVDTPVVSPRWRPSAYNPFCPFPPAPAVPSAVTATAVVVPPANPASTAFGSTLSVASAPALAPRNNMDDPRIPPPYTSPPIGACDPSPPRWYVVCKGKRVGIFTSAAEASNYTSGVSGGTNSMSSFSLWTRARKEYNDNWEKGLLEIA